MGISASHVIWCVIWQECAAPSWMLAWLLTWNCKSNYGPCNPISPASWEAPLAFLASHTCCSVPGHCNLVAFPEGDLTLKAYCSVVSFLPDLAFCYGTDQVEEHVCLLFSCYSNAFVFAPVAHALEVPVWSSLHVSILLHVKVKELCQVPDRWQT